MASDMKTKVVAVLQMGTVALGGAYGLKTALDSAVPTAGQTLTLPSGAKIDVAREPDEAPAVEEAALTK